MLRVLILVAALAPTVVLAEGAVSIGAAGRLPLSMPGCVDRADMERVLELYRQKDPDAAMAHLKRRIPRCRALDAGTVGVVEDRTILPPQLSCFRPKGETECLWVLTNTVSAP